MDNELPILFACSGCSHAGQLANELAVEFNQRSIAQMSCLAGIGAGKWHFLKQLAGRTVWVIDGCPLECSLGVFDQIHERIDVHIRLHDFGVRKTNSPLTDDKREQLLQKVLEYVAHLPKRADEA